MTVIDEVEALLASHLQTFEARLAKHERRMQEINAEHRARNEAILMRMQLELDGLRE